MSVLQAAYPWPVCGPYFNLISNNFWATSLAFFASACTTRAFLSAVAICVALTASCATAPRMALANADDWVASAPLICSDMVVILALVVAANCALCCCTEVTERNCSSGAAAIANGATAVIAKSVKKFLFIDSLLWTKDCQVLSLFVFCVRCWRDRGGCRRVGTTIGHFYRVTGCRWLIGFNRIWDNRLSIGYRI